MRMLLWAATLLLFAQASPAPAQNAPKENQANNQSATVARAPAEMKAGDAAGAKRDYAVAMAAYRRAIELDPQNVDAHKRFIGAAGRQANVALGKLFTNPDYRKLEHGQLQGKIKKAMQAQKKEAQAQQKAGDDALVAAYDEWIAAHPQMAVFYWAKGYALTLQEKANGPEKLFEKAISLDPKFVPAYNSMADFEFEKGDYAKQRDYLKQAMNLEPTNASAARDYAETFQFSDPAKFRDLAQQFADKFPNDSQCTYLLHQLENTEPTAAQRISTLEQMRQRYLDNSFSTVGMDDPDVFTSWLEEDMADLFNLYAQDAPHKALDLAEEMQEQKWADTEWGWNQAVAYQQNLLKAQELISAKKYSDASALLQRKFSGDVVNYELDRTPLNLASAEAQAGSGNVRQAFDNLAAAWIKTPDIRLHSALLRYGAKLGKTPQQVDEAVWKKWTFSAKEMKPFELKSLDSRKKLRLSDFRGRVTLVSFWFPLCGPCRSELPYLDEVAKKYQSQGFTILAINGIPAQNSYAPGVLKNYDVIGLKVPSDKWAQRYDHVSGYPTNYLLDSKGRIMAHPHVYDMSTLQAFEIQIDSLLAHATAAKNVVAKAN